MSINKTLKKALNNSSIDINLVVTSGSVFPLTSINIQINSNNHKPEDPTATAIQIAMDSSDEESFSSTVSRDLFDDSAETIRLSPRVLEYTDSEDDTEDLPVVNSDDDIVSEDLEVSENELIENNEFTIPVQESIDLSNGNAENAVIEINETLQYPANDDVIEIIDLCATQIPLPNLNFLESHFNSSVIEIFDSPSFLHSNIPTRRPRKRQRAIPYELTPAPSSSQSQLENPITCPICLDNVRNHTPVSTNCGHIFCKQCLIQALKSAKCCPMCKKSITRKNQSHDIFI